jgi:23S rRNA (uracil1939-C5)-methyltransferase
MARHRNKPTLPNDTTTDISNLSHDGRGVARIDGKTVFILGALPGETIRFRYLAQHRQFDEGITTEVLQASDQRVAPDCPHFGICGGCNFQHASAEAQIHYKQATLLEQLTHIGKIQPEQVMPPLCGNLWGYRHKARLGVRYVAKKESVIIGFREYQTHWITHTQRCPILHPSVGERITELCQRLNGLATRQQIPQLEMAVGEHQTALILRNLVDLPEGDLQLLRTLATEMGMYLYLQPGGIDSVTPLYPADLPLASLSYTLPNEHITVRFAPLDFTQINHSINQQMVTQALNWLEPQPDDTALDLFCGLGNFTLPLAQRTQRVIGIDVDASLLQRAEMNAKDNGIHNITYHASDLANDIQQASWMESHYSRILLDPPRSGAYTLLQALPFTGTKRLLYVSCNPATLARDAELLVHEKGFRLAQVGIMDMFPHTAHIEAMALFIH